MAKGYLIYHVEVRDPELYQQYIAADAEAFRKHGGRFLVRGGKNEILEGRSHARHVVIEFDSYQAALAYYRCPEYVAATAIRNAAADAEVVLVEGVD